MKVLSGTEVFSAGDDIWFLSDERTALFFRLNWLLNFQIENALKFEPRALPPRVLSILNECALKNYDFVESTIVPSQPYLIASENFVPNLWTIIVPKLKSEQEWIKKISQVWTQMNLKKARLFLPSGSNAGEFESLFSQAEQKENLSLVIA
jgi:hypothetical protein